MNSALLSSKKMDYCTPQGFFDALNAEFHFTLDAAATEKSAKCKNFYTPETDGLTSPWNIGGGSAFCNPPYGRALGAWVRKAYEEAQTGTTVVLLIPARTDTAYFHDYIYGKAEIRFLRGRLHFEDEDGNRLPPAPFADVVKTSDYIQTVVRKTAGGAPYVVIKDGFEVLAGFAPLKIITKQFLEDLSEFESACVSQYMREQKQALDAADPDKQDEGAEQTGMEDAESESE